MYYLYTVGFSLSGKTWLVEKIKKSFPNMFVTIDTRSIHDYLNTIEIFQDDNTVTGESFELRQEATYEIRKSLIKVLAKNGKSIIQDSCNQVKKERKERVDVVRESVPEVKIILLYVNRDIGVIEKRAKDLDAQLIKNGEEAAWIDLLEKQRDRMEVPNKDESDYFIEYNGGDFEAVIKRLNEILDVRP